VFIESRLEDTPNKDMVGLYLTADPALALALPAAAEVVWILVSVEDATLEMPT
jgi:hypothetical protein